MDFPRIDKYIQNFEDLAIKAKYQIGRNETIDLFLKGLTPMVTTEVIKQRPRNYWEIKRYAVEQTEALQ